MVEHAPLSLSGSARWLLCSGSVEAESHYESTSSVFANEGTLAHEMASACLSIASKEGFDNQVTKKFLTRYRNGEINLETKSDDEIVFDVEMEEAVEEYVEYISNLMTSDCELFIEQKVNLQIPESWGTLDAAVLDYKDGICHVIDFKYGRGVRVSPFENTQLQLYGCGVHRTLNDFYELDIFRLHVVQPRIFNIKYWDITLEDLIEFEKYAYKRAELALSKNAVRTPGEIQCRWCSAKSDCKALADFAEKAITVEFDNIDEMGAVLDIAEQRMSNEQKRFLLDNKNVIELFMKSVWDEVNEQLLRGEKFPGYKLVEGVGRNCWDDKAEEFLVEKFGDDAYQKNKKLITITNAKKLLDKNEIDKYLQKSSPNTIMVQETDNRPTVLLKGNKSVEFKKLEKLD